MFTGWCLNATEVIASSATDSGTIASSKKTATKAVSTDLKRKFADVSSPNSQASLLVNFEVYISLNICVFWCSFDICIECINKCLICIFFSFIQADGDGNVCEQVLQCNTAVRQELDACDRIGTPETAQTAGAGPTERRDLENSQQATTPEPAPRSNTMATGRCLNPTEVIQVEGSATDSETIADRKSVV